MINFSTIIECQSLSREHSHNSPLFFLKFNRFAFLCLFIVFSTFPLSAFAQWAKISSEKLNSIKPRFNSYGGDILSYRYGMIMLGFGVDMRISRIMGKRGRKFK